MKRIILMITLINLQKLTHSKKFDENPYLLENKIPNMYFLGNKKLKLITKNNDNIKDHFSLTGFFKYYKNEIPSINILKITNSFEKNNKINKNPKTKNFGGFKGNKNLEKSDFFFGDYFSENQKEKDNFFSFNLKNENDNVNFYFTFFENSEFEFSEIITQKKNLLKNDDFIYFAVTFDFINKKGFLYINFFSELQSDYKKQFFFNPENYVLKKNFSLILSNNNVNSPYLGVLYNLNFYYIFLPKIEIIQNYNFEENIDSDKLLQLFFNIKKEDKIVFSENKKMKFEISGNSKNLSKGIKFEDNSKIELGKFEKKYNENLLLKSKTFTFTLLTKNFDKNNIFFQGKNENSSFLIKFYKQKDTSLFGLEFIANKKKKKLSFRSSIFIKKDTIFTFSFTLLTFNNKFTKVLFFFENNYYEEKLFSETVLQIEKMKYTLLSSKNKNFKIILQKLEILKTPLNYLISIQKPEEFYKECKILKIKNDSKIGCELCKNKVTNIAEKKCETNCQKNTKNVGGICLPCLFENCKEITPTFLQVKRFSNNFFILELSREIPLFEKYDLEKLFKIELKNYILNKDYNLDFQISSKKKILLEIINYKPILQTILQIKFENSKFSSIYDINKDFIYSLDQNFKISSIRYLNVFQKQIIDVLVYIIIAIFLSILIIGFFLFVFSFNFHLTGFCLKKIVFLFQDIQLMAFLMLLEVPFSSNLHYFLINIYRNVIELSGLFVENGFFSGFFRNNPNFFDLHFSTEIVRNFGIVFIFHFVVMVLYFIFLSEKILKRFLPSQVRFFFKKMKDIFEYNFLTTIFFCFNYQIFIFTMINFQEPNNDEKISSISLMVTLFYYSFYFLGFLIFYILYKRNNNFLYASELKLKFTFFFIGFKNNKKSNSYEILRLTKQFLTSFILINLKSSFTHQITLLILLTITFLTLKLFIDPFENSSENNLDTLNQVFFMTILFFINFMSIFNSPQNTDPETYQFFGEIIIMLIFLKIFCYYVINLKQIIFYLKKLRSSSRLVFFNKHYSEEYRESREISSCKEEDYFSASIRSSESDYFGKIKDLEGDDRVEIDREHYDKFFNYNSRSEDFTVESSDFSGQSQSLETKKRCSE